MWFGNSDAIANAQVHLGCGNSRRLNLFRTHRFTTIAKPTIISSSSETHAMTRGNFSRRGFVQTSLALLGAYGLPDWHARQTFAAVQEKESSRNNGEVVRFGSIGIGSPNSRGRDVFRDFHNQKSHKIRGVAVCDVDNNHLGRAATLLQNMGYKEVTTYHDYRDLNDRK